MRHARIILALIAACFALSSPARAQDWQSDVKPIFDSLAARDGKAVIEKADRLIEIGNVSEYGALVHTLRAGGLLLVGQESLALKTFDRSYQMAPDLPKLAQLTIAIGLDNKNATVAVKGMDRILNEHPLALPTVEPQQIWSFLNLVREKRGEKAEGDYLLRFVGLGVGDRYPDFRDGLARAATLALLKRGEMDAARKRAATITHADVLEMLLTDRRMAPLWPDVEARVGPHMAAATEVAVRQAEAAYAEDENVVRARLNLMGAYIAAGRLADADRIGAEFAASPETMRAIDEDGGWTIDRHASVLRGMKRRAEADARYAAMRVQPVEAATWLINMIINRAETVVRDGDYAKGAPLVEEGARLADAYGNPYARQLLRRLKVCIAAGAGQSLDPVLAPFREHEADAAMASAEGYLCAGRREDAVRLVLAELTNPDTVTSAIAALQPEAAVREPDPSVWRKGLNGLLADTRVASAFDKVGRVLPVSYWPKPAS